MVIPKIVCINTYYIYRFISANLKSLSDLNDVFLLSSRDLWILLRFIGKPVFVHDFFFFQNVIHMWRDMIARCVHSIYSHGMMQKNKIDDKTCMITVRLQQRYFCIQHDIFCADEHLMVCSGLLSRVFNKFTQISCLWLPITFRNQFVLIN